MSIVSLRYNAFKEKLCTASDAYITFFFFFFNGTVACFGDDGALQLYRWRGTWRGRSAAVVKGKATKTAAANVQG